MKYGDKSTKKILEAEKRNFFFLQLCTVLQLLLNPIESFSIKFNFLTQ